MVKLDRADVLEIKKLLETKTMTDKQIALLFNVSRGHITKIKNKKRWIYDYREKSTTE